MEDQYIELKLHYIFSDTNVEMVIFIITNVIIQI
jgi:hypothetical protein